MEEERCYVTFPALTQVLKADKALSTSGIRYWIVPIPREISSDCGMCVMCYPDSIDSTLDLFEQLEIEFENTYSLHKKKLSFFK